ncbi:LmeA family phospholipid-binding protein [Leifsonia poae]|uniref:LmeA family phospholipid-binding protein n=1 Tax=Leifsonia poae TaxID=110933 RepID=UPI003D67EADC
MSDQNDAFASLFETNYQREKPRRRGRGWIIAGSVIAILVILGWVAFTFTDSGLRATAETVAAQQVQSRLPEGATGDVTVTIGGGPVISQYLNGSFDDVTVSVPALTADGATSALELRAKGVATDITKPVEQLSGTVTFGPAALTTVVPYPGTTKVALGDGSVTFSGTQGDAGRAIAYDVTATPSLVGQSIVMTPTAATVTSGAAAEQQPAIVAQLMAQKPAVCLAKYVPKGTTLTGVTVTPAGLALAFGGKNVTLSSQTFRSTATCTP